MTAACAGSGPLEWAARTVRELRPGATQGRLSEVRAADRRPHLGVRVNLAYGSANRCQLG